MEQAANAPLDVAPLSPEMPSEQKMLSDLAASVTAEGLGEGTFG
jgi:hypothetical protein